MMKKIFLFISQILIFGSLQAQKIAGTWYGTLNVQGTNLPLVFHITQSGDSYSTTMDSPMQKAIGVPLGKTTVTGNELVIEAANFGIKYTGTYMSDSTKIKGIFKQGPNSFPLLLSPGETPEIVVAHDPRPQDPTTFPYKREEVVFTNTKAGDQLAGTLTMPSSGKVSKIVVLITGSGPQNRDEEITQFNHRSFLVWSDWLTRNGIAVLRYDDRGIGKSTGNYNGATSADFADDAEAAVSYIQSRADLKDLSIGLIGHSEGGMIAPMIASRNKAIKFIVLLAGPGVPISQLMMQQSDDQARLSGITLSPFIKALATKLYAAINQYKNASAEESKAKIDTILHQEFQTLPPEDLGGQSVDAVVKIYSAQYNEPWFRYFLSFNPADYLTKVKCPVLALGGTLDMQVQAAANLAAIKTNLEKAGNTNFEIVSLPGLNHLFQQAITGSVPEYSEISETVNPAALKKVSSWIGQLK